MWDTSQSPWVTASDLAEQNQRAVARSLDLEITSLFQSVIDASIDAVVGQEAWPQVTRGRQVLASLEAFECMTELEDLIRFDHLCGAIHVLNFAIHGGSGLLFV